MKIAKELITRLLLDNDTNEIQSKSKKMIYFGTIDHISSMTDNVSVSQTYNILIIEYQSQSIYCIYIYV